MRYAHTCCYLLASLLLLAGCRDLDTTNLNNPDREAVLSTGADLGVALQAGYIAWWRGVHEAQPVLALSVAADVCSLPIGDFGTRRMGEEPRRAYNNRRTEAPSYRHIVEMPWQGCLSAVSTANDVIAALDAGISIDNGGAQDKSVRASALMLRGLAWGYLGLVFDQTLLADEDSDLSKDIPFSTYPQAIERAVAELEAARVLMGQVGEDFGHRYFNGLLLDEAQCTRLCHSYAARFLTQWPRTPAETELVDWPAVRQHAEAGITTDFAPLADGRSWTSYQRYAFAETGQGPFWSRIDQRLVAALDVSQPSRYPQVMAQGDPPLASPMASSPDARLALDFVFLPNNNFPADLGEWHFSHYKHRRNQSQAGFAGDGLSGGPMPVFLAADNALLLAEALLRTNQASAALSLLNAGPRSARGQLPVLVAAVPTGTVLRAIMYERLIELLGTAPMGGWFDRRRLYPRVDVSELNALGGLQTGTPAHLPVPAAELQIRGLPPYNIGGPADPEGILRQE